MNRAAATLDEAVDLVVDLVEASWTPPFEQPLLMCPDRGDGGPSPIHVAIHRGLVGVRRDGVLFPMRDVHVATPEVHR